MLVSTYSILSKLHCMEPKLTFNFFFRLLARYFSTQKIQTQCVGMKIRGNLKSKNTHNLSLHHLYISCFCRMFFLSLATTVCTTTFTQKTGFEVAMVTGIIVVSSEPLPSCLYSRQTSQHIKPHQNTFLDSSSSTELNPFVANRTIRIQLNVTCQV